MCCPEAHLPHLWTFHVVSFASGSQLFVTLPAFFPSFLSLVLSPNFFLPVHWPASSLLILESNTYLQYTKTVQQHWASSSLPLPYRYLGPSSCSFHLSVTHLLAGLLLGITCGRVKTDLRLYIHGVPPSRIIGVWNCEPKLSQLSFSVGSPLQRLG